MRSGVPPASGVPERVGVNAFHLGRPLSGVFVGALLFLSVVPSYAAENLAGLLRSFRAAPAGLVTENLHRVVSPVPLSIAPVSLSGYAAWAAEVFTAEDLANPQVSGPGAVRAEDGLTNLEKYALGLDPHVIARVEDLPESGQLDEHWFLWYRRPSDIDDVEYRVEVSTDEGATWSSEGVTQEPILANDLAQSWQAHYHAAAEQTVRVRLTLRLR